MDSLSTLKNWFQKNKANVQKDYFDFLKFKSISTDPIYKDELLSCAKWLKDYIEKWTDLKAELIETLGYPLVFAENKDQQNGKTVLVYGHYDVQPVDPPDLWKNDPFEPTVRDGKIYARGAVDDKGQIFYAVIAMRAIKELGIKQNVNIKFCIEGEEETASVGLSKGMKDLKLKLKSDALVAIDFDQFDENTPAISLGARGMAAFEVVFTGSNTDLHSGLCGGIAYNPLRALVEVLAKAWDDEGKVQIDGFYEDVVELKREEKEELSFSFDEKSYQKEFAIKAIGGEKGRSLKEKNGLRPTFEINGISGGYTGEGFKTVIPAKAIAKISCRLVPNQNPVKIAKQVENFFKKNVKQGIDVQVQYLGGEEAFRADVDSFLAKAIEKSAQDVTNKDCKKIVSGGSVPILSLMQKELRCSAIGMGYGLATDHIHAPNEHFDMDRFEKGFLTFAHALELI